MTKRLNNRTYVTWATRIGALHVKDIKEEATLRNHADDYIKLVPQSFIETLDELVDDHTYLRFGDFALEFFKDNPERLVNPDGGVEGWKADFDKLCDQQCDKDPRCIGELALENGLLTSEDLSDIEKRQYNYDHKHKPFQLILKETYEDHQKATRQRKLRVIAAALVAIGIGVAFIIRH